LKFPVHYRVATVDGKPVTWTGNYPLDEGLGGPLRRWRVAREMRQRAVIERTLAGLATLAGVGTSRRMKHNDVSDSWISKPLSNPIDKHSLSDRKRRLHRAAWNPIRLDNKLLDQKSDPNGRCDHNY